MTEQLNWNESSIKKKKWSHYTDTPLQWPRNLSYSASKLGMCILSDLMDCRLPGSSAHEIFGARILECLATSFSNSASKVHSNSTVLKLRHKILFKITYTNQGYGEAGFCSTHCLPLIRVINKESCHAKIHRSQNNWILDLMFLFWKEKWLPLFYASVNKRIGNNFCKSFWFQNSISQKELLAYLMRRKKITPNLL